MQLQDVYFQKVLWFCIKFIFRLMKSVGCTQAWFKIQNQKIQMVILCIATLCIISVLLQLTNPHLFLSISGHYTLKRICSFEKMNKIMFFCFAVILFVAVAKSFLFKPPRKGRNSIVRAAKTRKKPVILLFLSLFSWKTCKRPLAQQMLSSSATWQDSRFNA